MRVLIAFDGSPSARAAVEHSSALFPAAEVVVVSVVSGLSELEDTALTSRGALSDERIRAAVARLRELTLKATRELAGAGAQLATAAGLDARAETVTGDGASWDDLATAAHRVDADVVACGTRGHGTAARAVLGSVSSGLIHHAGLPVLVVPEEATRAGGPVIVAFDRSEPAARAVAAAGRLLPGRDALVLHVWRSRIRHSLAGQAFQHAPLAEVRDSVNDLDRLFEDWGREEAERGAALAAEHGLHARARAIESAGPAAWALLEAARSEDAAAIVVGRRGRGEVASAILGSVSASILHAADRPVLIA